MQDPTLNNGTDWNAIARALTECDEDAYHRLIFPERPLLRAHAASTLRVPTDHSDAELVVGEAVEKVYRAQRGKTIQPGLKGYVIKAVKNVAIDHLRKRKWETLTGDSVEPPGSLPQPNEQSEAEHRRARMRAAILKLEPIDRDIIRLKLAGLADRQIATIVGLSPANTAQHLSRARQELFALLKGEDHQ